MNQEMDLLGLAGRRWPVGESQFLRLLTAYEMVLCPAMAKNLRDKLSLAEEAEALAGNAVLISFALVGEEGSPVFPDAESVFHTLPAEAVNRLAERYAVCREEALGETEQVKKN